MQLITTVKELAKFRESQSQSTGFVPTMGALHSGHLALIAGSKAQNAQTVCSVFVNPTQFNDPKDFNRYPRQLSDDQHLLESAGCDVLFAPSVSEVYPQVDHELYDFGALTAVLEGLHRPGHFQGVASVVRRLLHLVQPDRAYFGLKDYQQFLVVRELASRYRIPSEIIGFPTVREASGLAKSSRNTLLSARGLDTAPILYETLNRAKENYQVQNIVSLEADAKKMIAAKGLDVEYFNIVDSETLQAVSEATSTAMALVAARLEGVRLIDNLRF